MAEASTLLCSKCKKSTPKVGDTKCEKCLKRLERDKNYQKQRRKNQKQKGNSKSPRKRENIQAYPNYVMAPWLNVQPYVNALPMLPGIMQMMTVPNMMSGTLPRSTIQQPAKRPRGSSTSHDQVLTEDGKPADWRRIKKLMKEINILKMQCAAWKSRDKMLTTEELVKTAMDKNGVCLLPEFVRLDEQFRDFVRQIPNKGAWRNIFQKISAKRRTPNGGDKKRYQLFGKHQSELQKITDKLFTNLLKKIGLNGTKKVVTTNKSTRKSSRSRQKPGSPTSYVFEANLLLAKAECAAQAFHTDERKDGAYDNVKTYPFSIIVGVSERAYLDVVPAKENNPVRVVLCQGDVLFFRGDVVHRGTENPWDHDNYRMHCYVDPTVDNDGKPYTRQENATIISDCQYTDFDPYKKLAGPEFPLY